MKKIKNVFNNIYDKLKFKSKTVMYGMLKPQLLAVGTILVDGKKVKQFYCESLVLHFLQTIYRHFNDDNANFANSQSPYNRSGFKTTAGTETATSAPVFKIDANAGVTTNGMVFGTGATAPTPLDYNLETPIAHGITVGKLSYQAQTSIQGCQVVGQDTNFILQRVAVNNSGGTINIAEIGLIYDHSSTYIMVLRDTFSNVEVLDTQTVTAQIEFKITT